MATSSLKGMAADPNVAGVKKTDLFRVDPRLLDEEDGFNLRDYNDPDVIAHIEGFADSYANGRYVPPLVVRTTIEGRIVPVEGHCRRRGALLAIERGAELAFVDCVSFKGGDCERIEVMLRSAEGLRLKPLEVAMGYLRLNRMGHTNAKIAEVMRKTAARVEQMLLLATANHDVHELVRAGTVTADAAIEAIREHRDNAGAYLMGKLEEAKGQGKGKVTRGVMRGPSLPPKVLTTVVGSLAAVVTRLDSATRRKLAEFEGLEPGQLEGKKIEVDAASLLELVKAHVAVDEVKAKREAAAAAAKAAAAQQELAMDGADAGGDAAVEPAREPEGDEFLGEAEKIVCAEGRASISLIQRKLRIGYNRAARLLEALERNGVVTPMDGKGERKVIVAKKGE